MPARVSPEDPEAHRTFALVDAGIQLGLILLAIYMSMLSPDDPVYQVGFGLLIVLIILLAPLAVIATIYLLRIYRHDTRTRRSWLLLRDALIGIRLTAVAIFLAVLGFLRLTGAYNLPWAGPGLVVALVVVAEVPLYMAAVYFLRRRLRGDYTSPPMVD